jgi:hypothetical protein
VFAAQSIVPAEEAQPSRSTRVVNRSSSNRGEARLAISATAKKKLNKSLNKYQKKNSKKLKKVKLKKLPKNVQKALIQHRRRIHDGKINTLPKSMMNLGKQKTKAKANATQK